MPRSLLALLVLLTLAAAQDLKQWAWITPVLDAGPPYYFPLSPACRNASQQYIDAFGDATDLNKNPTWGLNMMDMDGRLPMEGSLSNTVPIPINCAILQLVLGDTCFSLPAALTNFNLFVPYGFAKNPGRMEECLAHRWTSAWPGSESFRTKFCTVHILPATPPNTDPLKAGRRDLSYRGLVTSVVEQERRLRRLQQAGLESRGHKNISGWTEFQEHMELVTAYSGEDPTPTITQEQIFGIFVSIYAAINEPTIGMCFPAACSVDDININYLGAMADYNIPGLLIEQSLRAGTAEEICYTEDDKTGASKPNVDVVIYVVLGIIGLLVAVGTVLEVFPLLAGSRAPPGQQPDQDGLVMQLIKAFSLYSNGAALLSTKAMGSGHLDCMNGMKFISMTWVILGHTFMQALGSESKRNAADLWMLFGGQQGVAFEVVLNAFPSVDSFFLMGGCLTGYIVFRELERAGSNIARHIVTSVLYFVHRYLRLTIPYGLIMAVIVGVLPHLAYGPEWSGYIRTTEECREKGWQNLLYVNTLLKDGTGCMGVTWYLVDDMIFHIISLPVIFYPMHLLWKWKGHMASIGYLATFTLATTAFVFGLNYYFKAVPILFGDLGFGESTWTYHISLYNSPWNRYQPYLVGALLGYVLHHTRGKPIKIDQVVNLVLWQVSFLAAFAVVYGLHDLREMPDTTLLKVTAYNALQRLAWSFALSWVIFSCVKGYGGVVNDFLSWSVFTPLARLTYCCYLIHMEILTMFFASAIAFFPNDVSLLVMVMYFFGGLTFSLAAAAIFVLVFETPFTLVEKILVGKVITALLGDPSKRTERPPAPADQPPATTAPPPMTKMEEAEKDADPLATEEMEEAVKDPEVATKEDIQVVAEKEDSGHGSDRSQPGSGAKQPWQM